ncbi:hypothetical protein SPBRAN_1888 [uncultured Candidatus Thioglobus sp.]|nr:hypothetical protein SPBRAN_1888 [uncultured Candidatus Thioglobus sp.]
MASDRDTYKYHLKKGNKILHTGITNDLQRRESEHQQHYGNKVHIKQVGNRTTREAGYQWESEQRKDGKPVGP